MKQKEFLSKLEELIQDGEKVRASAELMVPHSKQISVNNELFFKWKISCCGFLETYFKTSIYLETFKNYVRSRGSARPEGGIAVLNALKGDLEKGYLGDYILAKQQKVEPEADNYVAEERIKDLWSLQNPIYDPTKLIKLIEELNQNYKWKNYFAVGALLRTILHHIPPIFEMKNFEHVASEYNWGKSNKDLIMRLYQSAKNIADNLLHSNIRKRESLPKKTRVNFAPELDVLLGEILIRLKS